MVSFEVTWDASRSRTVVPEIPDVLLREHHVLVDGDKGFQRAARLLQALWREARGHPIGERCPGAPLGSRLPKDFAWTSGANLMTEASRAAARRELAAVRAGSGQAILGSRLWENLLSSQPLAFNLFADLGSDLEAATRVLRRLWPERVARVTRLAFEYSPGRASLKYTHDRTAFDVYVEHATPRGGRGFIGVEVKYHEALDDTPARHRPRYDEVTKAMGCFRPERLAGLRRKPIAQIWRDHMLAGAMLLDGAAGWETGLYVLLSPKDNEPCQRAALHYLEHLLDESSFAAVTLEDFVDALEAEAEVDAGWPAAVRDRYLDWSKIAALL